MRKKVLARMFPKQRGIISFGFGGGEEETIFDEEREVKRRRTLDEEEERRRSDRETRFDEEIRELFSPEMLGLLEGAFGDLIGEGFGSEEIEGLAAFLGDRAMRAEEELNKQNAAIIGENRRQGERKIGAQTTAFGTAAGSTQNTLVQQQRGELQNDLELQLAALDAGLRRENRQVATEELKNTLGALMGAVTAKTADVQSVSRLGELLKGGRSVFERRGETTREEEEFGRRSQELDELIESLTRGRSTTERDGFKFGFGF
jgi:hypothetical protein